MSLNDTNDEGILGVRILLDSLSLAAVDTICGFEELLGEFGDGVLFGVGDFSN